MSDELTLMIPGPTGLPDEVREALGKPQIGHRTPEYSELMLDVTAGMKHVFQTENDLLILTSSGTGGLEAAIVNFLSPGDAVLAIAVGNFGERIGKIAEIYGAEVTWVKSEWGQPADLASAKKALAEKQFKAVLFTQNETSTSVTNPVAELAALATEAGALTIVDAVSGMGAIEVRTDEWGLDVVVAGSQKALMLPPGLAFVSVSDRAWAAAETSTMPKFYFDLAKAKGSLAKGQTPYTPNTSLIVALQAALKLIRSEGIENVWKRHAACAERVREGVQALGLKLFNDPEYSSNVVTAFCPPEGVDEAEIRTHIQQEYGILVTGAQGAFKGQFLRIGHLGTVDDAQVDRVLSALEDALKTVAPTS